jgi:hypothetical protein
MTLCVSESLARRGENHQAYTEYRHCGRIELLPWQARTGGASAGGNTCANEICLQVIGCGVRCALCSSSP